MKRHDLKCVSGPFQAKWDKKKDWEFRKNDRDFQVGDELNEREYEPLTDTYSGREILEIVVWILHGGAFGVPSGYVIMSTKEIYKVKINEEQNEQSV